MAEQFGVRRENLLGAIGPCIGGCCYEVDDVVREQMPGYERFFQPKGGGKYWLDLAQVNWQQLREA